MIFKIKNGLKAPTTSNLSHFELGWSRESKNLFINNAGTIVRLTTVATLNGVTSNDVSFFAPTTLPTANRIVKTKASWSNGQDPFEYIAIDDVATDLSNNLASSNAVFQAVKKLQTTVNDALLLKVDKVSGKGLSTNDFTNADKAKIVTLETSKQDKLIAGDNITIIGNTISGEVDSKITDYVYTADGLLRDGLNPANNVDLQNVRDTFHPEDVITVSNIKIGHNIKLRINRPDGGSTEYGVATIIGYSDESETEIQTIVKKYSGSILSSESQFLTIGTIIKHPDYPNNVYVNTTGGHFSLSNFESALTANVIKHLLTDLDAHKTRFNGSGTNYLTAKTQVEGAIKELDTQVKSNADDLNAMPYYNYASRIYDDKYNLLANAWEHSLTVDPLEIIANSTTSNQRGKAQYPNGETEGVIIPNTVTSIGNQAFRNWLSNNQPLIIPNTVTSIGYSAFRDWESNNQPLVIPNSVTDIGNSAFRNWNSNTHPLVIPDSVTSIEDFAFYLWLSVPYVEIQAITPPTLAHADAFAGQNNAPIYVPDDSVEAYKTATNWVDLASRIFPISDKDYTYSKTVIDNKDTAIMNKANNLENANMLKDVVYNNVNGVLTFTRYDDTTKEIDLPLELLVNSGYYDEVANELVLVLANGSEIKIPVGNLLTDLDAHNIRFSGSGTNYLVNKLDVEGAIKELDTQVKSNADDKVDKVAGKGLSTNDLTNALKSNYDTAYTHSQTAHAPSNAQKNSDITKAEIEAKLTGEIASHSHALPTHTHTKSQITDFPTSMPPTAHTHDDRYYTETEVDTKLAGKQDKLVAGDNITIDENTNVISVEVDPNEMAYFDYAGSIYGAKYNLLTSAWERLLTVDPLEISANGSLGNNRRGTAQYPNGETEGVIIPQGVTTIGDWAFDGWKSNNQLLVIPNSVTSIGGSAFNSWTSNNQLLVIPNSVTSIGGWAFRGWTANNQPLVIPNSVTSIGSYAFGSWSKVPYVEMKGTTPPSLAHSDAFNNQGDAPIYVPNDSVDDYKTATNWVLLANRIFPTNDKADLMGDIEGLKLDVQTIEQSVEGLENNKVDKVQGKGLSAMDYTFAEKYKLNGIKDGAQKNVQSDWNATSGDALILNKPAIPTKVSDLTNDKRYITGYTETDPIFTAWNKSTGISITKSQVSDLIEATQALSGLMSATDKTRLDVLHGLLEEDTANNVVDSINEVLAIFNNYPEGADLVTALADKVDKVAGKGLSTNDYTTAEKNKLSGIETGAEVNEVNSVNGKQGVVVLNQDDIGEGSTYKQVSQAEKNTWNNKQDKLTAGDNITIDNNVISASGGPIVDLGTFDNETELITYAVMNQLPTGQYTFIMDSYPCFMLMETHHGGYRGTFQFNNAIFYYFDVSFTGVIDELKTIDLKDLPDVRDLAISLSGEVDGLRTEVSIIDNSKADITYVDSRINSVENDITQVDGRVDDLEVTLGNIDAILDSILGV